MKKLLLIFCFTGLFGKGKITIGGSETDQSIKFGKNGDFKSSDYGITSLIGFKTERRFTMNLMFDLGIPNIRETNPDNIDNDQFKNRAFYVSFGQSF